MLPLGKIGERLQVSPSSTTTAIDHGRGTLARLTDEGGTRVGVEGQESKAGLVNIDRTPR
ncbi:MAG: hypothetical protein ACRDV8_09470 [Acidimicrobiales bacterium]